jgi:hypothetical protein
VIDPASWWRGGRSNGVQWRTPTGQVSGGCCRRDSKESVLSVKLSVDRKK